MARLSRPRHQLNARVARELLDARADASGANRTAQGTYSAVHQIIPSRDPQRHASARPAQGSRAAQTRRRRRPARRGRRNSFGTRVVGALLTAGAAWFIVTQVFPVLFLPLLGAPAEPAPDADGVIERVVDGDTVLVTVGGVSERVRILNIDTPESVTPDVPVECLGLEASAFTSQLLPAGTPVRLSFDAEPRDQHSRMLASVALGDGRSVGAELARAGLATPVQFGANARFLPDVETASAEARAAQVGLFAPGACAG